MEKNSAALVKETQQLRFHSLSPSLSLSYQWICSTPKINSIAQIEKLVIQKQQEFLRLDKKKSTEILIFWRSKQEHQLQTDRRLLFFNQTAAVLFPNSKQLFFFLAFFQQDSQKKLPGHKKITTQQSSIPRPQNLKIWIQKQRKVP
jgi:hypothetical protein